MFRYKLIAVALVAAVTCSVLSAGDVFTGVAPKTATYASDKRSDLEKLQDQVDDMSYLLEEALYVIDANADRINDLETALTENDNFINALKSRITITNSSFTIDADRINLNTDRVDINAPQTTVDGDLECDELVTDFVDADKYTPGAGNIW